MREEWGFHQLPSTITGMEMLANSFIEESVSI